MAFHYYLVKLWENAEMNKVGNRIFISHSSRDTLLIKQIKDYFKKIDVEPYFAFLTQEGKDPKTKIIDAIYKSSALFVLVTENVLKYKHTRDWVSFEIGVAKGIEKESNEEKRVYAWLINIDEKNDELAYLRYLTDYQKKTIRQISLVTFETKFDQRDIDDLANQIVNKASEVVDF